MLVRAQRLGMGVGGGLAWPFLVAKVEQSRSFPGQKEFGKGQARLGSSSLG